MQPGATSDRDGGDLRPHTPERDSGAHGRGGLGQSLNPSVFPLGPSQIVKRFPAGKPA
jgi:hypothetical protein